MKQMDIKELKHKINFSEDFSDEEIKNITEIMLSCSEYNDLLDFYVEICKNLTNLRKINPLVGKHIGETHNLYHRDCKLHNWLSFFKDKNTPKIQLTGYPGDYYFTICKNFYDVPCGYYVYFNFIECWELVQNIPSFSIELPQTVMPGFLKFDGNKYWINSLHSCEYVFDVLLNEYRFKRNEQVDLLFVKEMEYEVFSKEKGWIK